MQSLIAVSFQGSTVHTPYYIGINHFHCNVIYLKNKVNKDSEPHAPHVFSD